jgi:hypothetical protein
VFATNCAFAEKLKARNNPAIVVSVMICFFMGIYFG